MPPYNSPIVRGNVQQYAVTAPAGSDQAPLRSTTANAGRTYFYIQNTGSKLGVFWWDTATPAIAGSAIELLPGDWREWAVFVPTQAVNFGSQLGTTFAVVEGKPD